MGKDYAIGQNVDSILFAIQDLCTLIITPKNLLVAKTSFRCLMYLVKHYESYVERDEEAETIEEAERERKELEATLGFASHQDTGSIISPASWITGDGQQEQQQQQQQPLFTEGQKILNEVKEEQRKQ